MSDERAEHAPPAAGDGDETAAAQALHGARLGATLWRQGRRDEALAIWSAAVDGPQSDPKPLLERADRLRALGEAGLAMRDYARVLAVRPGMTRAQRGAAEARRALGDFAEAFAHWRHVADRKACSHREIQEAVEAAVAAGDVAGAASAAEWIETERRRGESYCAWVALPIAAALGDGRAAAAALRSLDGRFGARQAAFAAAALEEMGALDEAAETTGERLRPKAQTPELGAERLRLLMAVGRGAEAAQERVRLEAALGRDLASAAPRALLSDAERVDAVEAAFDGLEGPWASTDGFAALGEEAAEAALAAGGERLERLARGSGWAARLRAAGASAREGAAGADAADENAAGEAEPPRVAPLAGGAGRALTPGRLEHLIFAARVRDAARIGEVGLGATGWADFVRARAEAADAIEATCAPFEAASAGGTPEGGTAPLRMTAAFGAHRQARTAAKRDWTLSNPCFHDAAELAAWIAERIERGTPTAWVRLDEDAQAFAPPAAHFEALAEADRRAVWRRWVGAGLEQTPDAAWIAAASASTAAGLGAADALGVPALADLLRAARGPATAAWRGGVSAVSAVARFSDERLSGLALTDARADLDLARWGLWAEALGPARSIAVIGGRDLAEAAAARFGAAVSAHYAFPARAFEARASGLSASGAALAAVEAAEERLSAAAADVAGRAHLIAAGPFAGRLAARIKALGGVALDVGGVAAAWAGARLSDRADGGVRAGPIAAVVEGSPVRDRFDVAALRESAGRRRDGSGAAAVRLKLGVMGLGAEDTAEAARALRSAGLELGTDAPGRDGIADWSRAGDDASSVRRGAAAGRCAFEHVIAAVRDPKTALPALLVELCAPEVFAYRRLHVARATGVDLGARRDPLQRAALCLLLWTEIVAARRPLATLRFERASEDLRASAVKLQGLAPEIAVASAAAAAARAGAERFSARGGSEDGAAARRLAAARELCAPAQARRLPSAILRPLEAYCRRWGYSFAALTEE